MKIVSIFLISLVIISQLFARSDQFCQVESQTGNSLTLKFQFPELQVEKYPSASSAASVTIPGLNYNYEENKPLLPFYHSTIVVPPGQIHFEILSREIRSYPDVRPVVYKPQQPLQDLPPAEYNGAAFPGENFALEELGIFRDYRLMGIRLYPVQVTPAGLTAFTSLTVKIYWGNAKAASMNTVSAGENKIFDKIALNSGSLAGIQPAIKRAPEKTVFSPNAANPGNRVKMFVNEEGIYRVTGQDLLDAGVDVQSINPQTFRLTNKGSDVAILLRGEQDLSFDAEDYFEFFGEPNQKTFLDKYPDVYTDPFTDENVYWISWGGNAGIRMVEESGAIIETNPAKYNSSPFYRYTLHVEKNGHFERLGYSNTHNLSYTQDSWFFDSGVQSIGKKTYDFNLVYPDSSSDEPVRVLMKFTGRSQTNHSMMVWLNNRLVGQTSGGWSHQTTYTIDNRGNPAIYNFDLTNGMNQFQIQMPALAPNGETDLVLFNWADITYDRQYRASDNYIEFYRPVQYGQINPSISLYQFEIPGFTRPDIEVYKKGISKIVNYDIIRDTTGSRTRYKIVFQDNITSDDISYVALAKDRRLKPLRIEPEKPFNIQQPQLTLKSSANSADYLIITHEKLYERAKELAEFRRLSGLNVEMVKVQDIYDEFNYGIKSPLAIRDFLKYAFYNWDRSHRLKYVLLLGSANYNYKTTSEIYEDLVPTLFYQTYKFGAVSSDFTYSLVAGDDDIPDLFVGRIPAGTNGELTNIITKIKTFETEPLYGAWHNQTLFISGNDRSTYELPDISGIPRKPAFRAQNQRVIDMLLPAERTAFKLNTVKDDSLQYDPNFGGTTDLIEYMDNGVNFMTFLGHGGGRIWADVQLMNIQDVDRLNNQGKYPLVASMTCFTGAFENPGKSCLAQKMLLSPDKGAIGMFASSGLGWVANDYAMLWNLMKHLYDTDVTFGEAVTYGKIDYYNDAVYVVSDTIVPGTSWGHSMLKYDMIHQYNLLGDPYISLQEPAENINIRVDNDLPQGGDTIDVRLTSAVLNSEGYLELANDRKEIIYREPLFYSGGEQRFSLVIPEDSSLGNVYVRAYLANNGADASGVKQLGVNASVIDSIATIPARPNAEDSVSVRLIVRDKTGISGVKIVVLPGRLPNAADTLHLGTQQVAPNTYETIRKIPPTHELSTVLYFVYVTRADGSRSRQSFSYQVSEDRPDPFVYPNSIRLVGNREVELGVSVGNSGTVDAEMVELSVYNGRDNFAANQPFSVMPLNIGGQDSLTAQLNFPLPLDTSGYQIYALLDARQVAPDFNRQNNLDSADVPVQLVNITPELGTTYDKTKTDTIIQTGGQRFLAEPGSFSQPSAASFRLTGFKDEWYQEGLEPVVLRGAAGAKAVELQIFNPEARISAPMHLDLYYEPTAGDTNDVRLYRWNDASQVWIQHEAVIDTPNLEIHALLMEGGRYAAFLSRDNHPPRIELTVDGRQIRNKSLVSPDPVLNILIEDESGLQIQREQIAIMIDGVSIPREKLLIPDTTQQSQVLGITAYPELNIGNHQLSISVKDVNGNQSTREFDLKVDDQFSLRVYGNYPNPFTEETIFSYYITGTNIIDELEIRIFTTSGRLIRRITNDINTSAPGNDPRRVGYNELIWDGTDDNGNEVANGVYFALIKAKFENEERQEILKVAKLK